MLFFPFDIHFFILLGVELVITSNILKKIYVDMGYMSKSLTI